MNLIKNFDKAKNRKHIKSNLFCSNKFNILKKKKKNNIEKFTNLSFASKQQNFGEFKTKVELFYDESEGIKPPNKDQEKDVEHKQVILDKAFKSYNTLLKIYI